MISNQVNIRAWAFSTCQIQDTLDSVQKLQLSGERDAFQYEREFRLFRGRGGGPGINGNCICLGNCV